MHLPYDVDVDVDDDDDDGGKIKNGENGLVLAGKTSTKSERDGEAPCFCIIYICSRFIEYLTKKGQIS